MSETAMTFDDVLLVPAYNHHESRRTVEIGMTDKTGKLTLELPVMTANMDTITEDGMADFISAKGGIGILHRFCSVEENVAMFLRCKGQTFVSVGTSEKEMERVEALKGAGAQYFCVDVAHGHAKYVGKMIKRMRQMLPNECIMAGNVATYAGADYLASVKADIVKVGIGPGSVCTTRIKTGFGVPQLTAIQECARADRSIVADGGIRYAGDIVKALAFG
ncbi:MAG: guanosine monophosphate reductase, partial [Holophaga sp.]|nr:guanosine monophosphate reductase [Holophaga sp.]